MRVQWNLDVTSFRFYWTIPFCWLELLGTSFHRYSYNASDEIRQSLGSAAPPELI